MNIATARHDGWFSRFSIVVAAFMFSAMILLFLTITLREHETKILPIVKDFNISEAFEDEGNLVIRGTMTKLRECVPQEVNGQTVPVVGPFDPVEVTFEDEARVDTRPLGLQNWGPWTLTVRGGYEGRTIRITSRHQCEFPWQTRTVLATITASRSEDGSIVISQQSED